MNYSKTLYDNEIDPNENEVSTLKIKHYKNEEKSEELSPDSNLNLLHPDFINKSFDDLFGGETTEYDRALANQDAASMRDSNFFVESNLNFDQVKFSKNIETETLQAKNKLSIVKKPDIKPQIYKKLMKEIEGDNDFTCEANCETDDSFIDKNLPLDVSKTIKR